MIRLDSRSMKFTAGAAALVQVTNTAANPAITLDVSKLAAQSVSISANASNPPFSINGGNPGGYPFYILPYPDLVGPTQFSVPDAQSLVITSLEITNFGVAGDFSLIALGTNPPATELSYEQWPIPAATTVQYTFPSGFVIAAGVKNLAALLSNVNMTVTVHGYLTAN